ncbi:hypothetical protein AABM38_06605 [Heyndrickxia sp. MSNUG]
MMKGFSISMLKVMVDFAALLIEAAGFLERNSTVVFNTAKDRVN